MTTRLSVLVLFVGALGTAAGCAATATTSSKPAILQPGAPGQESRDLSEIRRSTVKHTEADVKFMQGMIGHHQQAIEMALLLKTRTSDEGMKLLALRIEVSQADEIKLMQAWLESRGAEVPSVHAMHVHGATLMPGMLTAEEMERLAAAKGTDFDKLFLEGMIKHHNGALIMVKELFDSPGGGQESNIFAFASDVDADQRMEIDRMRAMRGAIK